MMMKRIDSVLRLMVMGSLVSWGAGCAAGGGGGGGGTGERPIVNQDDDSGGPVNDGGDDENTADDDEIVEDDSGGEVIDGGQNDADGGEDDGALAGGSAAVVKTRIVAGVNGKIDVGDDLIVYGIESAPVNSDQAPGVHYLIPSRSDDRTTAGTLIPNSDRLFGPDDFKVAERKVALVRGTNAVSIFDTRTEKLVDISPSALTLDRSGGEPHSPGQMTSDGPFIAAINNVVGNLFGSTTVAVIDVSGDNPVVLDFPRPEDFDEVDDFDQVAVDAESRRVIALGRDNFYLYEIDKPGAQPIKFDFGFEAGVGSIGNTVQVRFDGGHVIYHDDDNFDEPAVSLLNVEDGTVTHFDDNPTNVDAPVALAGGSFGYFLLREAADNETGSFKTNVYRSAIGRIDDAPSATLASQTDHFKLHPTIVDEPGFEQSVCVEPNKLVGYGATQCITPDGKLWFLAGWNAIDSRFDHVQFSRGGAFEDIPDPERTTYTGSLMGTDIVCSADTVAFRGLREIDDLFLCGTTEQAVIAFIRLDQFER